MAIRRMQAASRGPSIPRYLLLQACAGAAIGVLAACALLLSDPFGLRELLAASADLHATASFILSGVTTLAPLVFATAVGLLAQDL
jgi:hypothetical protein